MQKYVLSPLFHILWNSNAKKEKGELIPPIFNMESTAQLHTTAARVFPIRTKIDSEFKFGKLQLFYVYLKMKTPNVICEHPTFYTAFFSSKKATSADNFFCRAA